MQMKKFFSLTLLFLLCSTMALAQKKAEEKKSKDIPIFTQQIHWIGITADEKQISGLSEGVVNAIKGFSGLTTVSYSSFKDKLSAEQQKEILACETGDCLHKHTAVIGAEQYLITKVTVDSSKGKKSKGKSKYHLNVLYFQNENKLKDISKTIEGEFEIGESILQLTQMITTAFSDSGFVVKNIKAVSSPAQNTFEIDESSQAVVDNAIKFVWQRCSAGQNSIDCSGEAKKFNWKQAKEYCDNLELADQKDWELPSIDDLKTIMYKPETFPAYPTIDQRFFRYTVPSFYWSSTAYAGSANGAWQAYFYNGETLTESKSKLRYVRCIRKEEPSSAEKKPDDSDNKSEKKREAKEKTGEKKESAKTDNKTTKEIKATKEENSLEQTIQKKK